MCSRLIKSSEILLEARTERPSISLFLVSEDITFPNLLESLRVSCSVFQLDKFSLNTSYFLVFVYSGTNCGLETWKLVLLSLKDLLSSVFFACLSRNKFWVESSALIASSIEFGSAVLFLIVEILLIMIELSVIKLQVVIQGIEVWTYLVAAVTSTTSRVSGPHEFGFVPVGEQLYAFNQVQ